MSKLLLVLTLTIGAASYAQAATLFVANWSGAFFGNGATAEGLITFDETILPNPVNYNGPPPPLVLAATITVSGATSGNGTFTLADFSGFLWNTAGITLNLTQQLVGQGGWGPLGVGDFNFFSSDGGPGGVQPFALSPAGTTEPMFLTSLIAAPEPGTIAFFLLGAAAFAAKAAVRGKVRL